MATNATNATNAAHRSDPLRMLAKALRAQDICAAPSSHTDPELCQLGTDCSGRHSGPHISAHRLWVNFNPAPEDAGTLARRFIHKLQEHKP